MALIRSATEEDYGAIFGLIKEMAEFEKLSHEVTLSAEEFCEHGKSGCFKCLVAEENGALIGYALTFPNFSSFQGTRTYLEDIYVKPDYRGKGIGTSLYSAVCEETFVVSERLRFICLAWNSGALEWYTRTGASDYTQALALNFYRITRPVLEQIAAKGNGDIGKARIRESQRSDSKAVHKLTSEFADYLTLIKHTLPLNEFEEAMFMEESPWRLLVAEVEDTVIGYAMFYPDYSTFQGPYLYLEELFVNEQYRGKGIGQALLAAVANEAVKKNYCRIQFVVWAEDKHTVKFYERQGASDLTKAQGWHYFNLIKDKWRKT